MSFITEITTALKASMGVYQSKPDKLYGVLGEFEHPGALVDAAKATYDAGYRHFDAHSPFPIHGMDNAMGLGNSKVGLFSLVGGLTGLALGYWLQWWTGAVDYPLNISGKPSFAIEPSIPVIFEITILFAAFGAVLGMFALNGLPRPYNPLFYSRRFAEVTNDAFFIHIAASDKHFSLQETAQFLKSLGAMHVEAIEDDEVSEEEREAVAEDEVDVVPGEYANV